MSNMDFQRCNKCNKVLDMTCSCSPNNYIVQLPVSDHVSKSELRAWCEMKKARVAEDRKGLCYYEDREDITHLEGMRGVLDCILGKFCESES